MVRRQLFIRSCTVALLALGAAGLGACNKSASEGATAVQAQAQAEPALPLTTGEALPVTRAPSVDALPTAAPAPVVRVSNADDQYAYLDQAYYQADAFEDAPPDYAFDYDGTSPWAWQSADDAREFAEPVDGGYRYYYYQPGQAYPYLIRDPGYSYGFDRGQLAAVYGRDGRILPQGDIDRRAGDAGRYLARSQALLNASRTAGRRSVAAANWSAARSQMAAQRAQLSADCARQSAWRAYNQAHAAQQTAYWDNERTRRQDYAQRFEGWRQANYQGAAPALAAAHAEQARVEQDRVDQARQDQTRQNQQAAEQRQQQDQARQQAENQRRQQDQHRQQADQQRQQQEQARQQAENQHRQQDQQRAQQAQARNQQRQQADQQHRQAEQQAQQQRQQAQQQHQQAEQQAQQQRQQAQAQAQQQRLQQQQAQAQARQAQPGSRPAGHDEHREHHD